MELTRTRNAGTVPPKRDILSPATTIGGNAVSGRVSNKVIPLPRIDTEAKLILAFERVRSEIAKIETLEEAARLRSQAEALRVYAVQVKCSKQVLDQIAQTKVRAERRLGQLLLSRPETRGGDRKSEHHQNQKSTDSTFDSTAPTLENIGVSKFLSSRSQLIATLPEAEFEKRLKEITVRGREITSRELVSFAKYLQRESNREARRKAAAEEAAHTEPDDLIVVRHGDFREVLSDIPDGSVQLILTDPLYLRENLRVWEDLAAFAERVLKLGHLLAAYCGNYYLFECMKALSTRLNYVWTCPVVYRSFPDTLFKHRIKTYWKPVLLFSKGEYVPELKTPWIHDLINGDGVTKDNHRWEQGIGEASHLIEGLSYAGDLVVDPFFGSGTTAVAAKRLGRRFIGCDIDQHCVYETQRRLAQEFNNAGE